ncbi:MAG: DUF4386 domain-containing protein [Anaerolineae bacterium]|nr:DUF4386 domain-containing protein [Anaerolineae bacterium]
MTSTIARPPASSGAATSLRTLYIAGGLAPLVTLVLYLSELLLIPWDGYPATTENWFALFQHSKMQGLFVLNALDIISIALLGVMFLALFMALRQTAEAPMIIAIFFGLLGVVVFIVPRVAMLSIVSLSDRYAVAASEVERARLLAAGETLGSLGTPTPQTVGFLFMAVAVLIISLVMLRSRRFGRVIAWFGLLASLFTFADHITLIVAPTLSAPLMIASGLFWLPWWVMIGLGLLRLARQETPQSWSDDRVRNRE